VPDYRAHIPGGVSPAKAELTLLFVLAKRHVECEDVLIKEPLRHHAVKEGRSNLFGSLGHGRVGEAANAIKGLVEYSLFSDYADHLFLNSDRVMKATISIKTLSAHSYVICSEKTFKAA